MKISSDYQRINNTQFNKKRKIGSLAITSPAFKALYINKSISNNLNISCALPLERLLELYCIQDKVNQFTEANVEALQRLYEKFKRDFFIADLFNFLKGDKNPDCVSFEALVERFKKDNIENVYYFMKLLKFGKKEAALNTDFEKINDYLDFRLTAINNKNLMSKHNHVATITDVDEILFDNIKLTSNTLDLIGETAFLFSFKEKKDNVLAFINDLGHDKWNIEIYNELRKKINPLVTDIYSFYETDISRLKELFPKITEPEQLNKLKKLINTLTKEKRELVENSIKDPKEILEKALIIAALNNNGLIASAKELLNILNPKTDEEKNIYNQTLNKVLFEYYDIKSLNEKTLDKIDLKRNRYLPRLFYTKSEFKEAFKSLILLLNENSEKSNLEIFNTLPKNIQTKMEFESQGINYDKWCSYDPKAKLECKLNDKNVITVNKVDMNNISKALFLGDEADCCTRVNGKFPTSAVNYITTKMIQAIEVYHNNLPIGNTMCYFAKINGKTVLVLDNIEVKKQYKYDDVVKKAFFDYAKQLVKDIGCPDMPIMLSNKRNDITVNDLKTYYYDIDIIGSTGDDKIYFDFKTNLLKIDDSSRHINNVGLIPITPNAPQGRSDMFEVKFLNNVNNNDTLSYNSLYLHNE